MQEYVKTHFKRYSQGAIRFQDEGIVIYIDPYKVNETNNDADYVFLTHSHYDHFSPEDIKKVIKESTVFIAPETMEKEMQQYNSYKIIYITPQNINVPLCYKLSFSCIPAYNSKKTKFHPKENQWVGYVVMLGEFSFYYTGDTEYVKEMDNINPDVMFVPLGPVYTMCDVNEAVKSVKAANAKAAVPVHYADGEGSIEDALSFCDYLDNDMEAFII